VTDDAHPGPLAGLSRRERMVATRFAEGLTYREIGAQLCVAPATVRMHLEVVYRKLGIHTKAALVSLVATQRAHGPSRAQAGHGALPTLAVLPFANLAGDARWDRLADGLTQDLMTDLVRHTELQVIARDTMLSCKERQADLQVIGAELGADYALGGSVQASGGQVRVTARLLETGTGAHVWAERYHRAEGELFAIQDEVVQSVGGAIGGWSGRLVHARREVARRRPPASLEAYDLYLLAIEQKHRFTRAGNAEAIRLLSRAVELDPDLARAWTVLGLAHAVAASNGFTDDPSAAVECWRACTERALALDPWNPKARMSLGDLHGVAGDLAAAAREYERALVDGGGDADILAFLAASFALVTGEPERAVALGRRALALDPHAPPWYFGALGRAEFVSGRYDESIATLHRAPPEAPVTLLFLAMAHARRQEAEQSLNIATRLRALAPGFTVEGFIRDYPVTNPPAIAATRAGAAAAGLLIDSGLAGQPSRVAASR
jgi:TolB-like protein/Flp pilus assembly protein TadD